MVGRSSALPFTRRILRAVWLLRRAAAEVAGALPRNPEAVDPDHAPVHRAHHDGASPHDDDDLVTVIAVGSRDVGDLAVKYRTSVLENRWKIDLPLTVQELDTIEPGPIHEDPVEDGG